MLLLVASALANDVLWYETSSSSSTGNGLTSFEAALVGVGATGVDRTSTFPSLSGYDLVVIACPMSDLDSSDVTALSSWMASGGTLVLIADNSGHARGHGAVVNDLLDDLGSTMSVDESASLDSGCNNYASVVATHDLTDGVGTPEYAATSDIDVGSATGLIEGTSGQTLLAVEDSIVLSADVNLFDDACGWGADNEALIENLWTWSACDPDNPDADGDGYDAMGCGGDDCDDSDPAVNPLATEVCDGVDNDCDGAFFTGEEDDDDDDGFVACLDCDDADAEVGTYLTWYADQDADGWGDPDAVLLECEAPSGYVELRGDCDDAVETVYPGADELCDELDNDCDGSTDEGVPVDAPIWYGDQDGDGYGVAEDEVVECEAPSGYVELDGDCDDAAATVHPDADEVCNGLDDDCDEQVDVDALDAATWYEDGDGDGYGNPARPEDACDAPDGHVDNDADCDDQDADVYPEAPGYDDACDELPPPDVEHAEDCSGCSSGVAGTGWLVALLAAVTRRRSGASA